MAFTPKNWTFGSVVDNAALQDLEIRLSTYTDQALTIARQTSDMTPITANIVLQNWTGLTFNVNATGTDIYFIKCMLIVSTATGSGTSTTQDMKFGWTFPTGTTMDWAFFNHANTGLAGFSAQTSASSPAQDLTQSQTQVVGTPAGGVRFLMELGGLVYGGGTAGAVQLQVAQSVSDGSSFTPKANSFMSITKIA